MNVMKNVKKQIQKEIYLLKRENVFLNVLKIMVYYQMMIIYVINVIFLNQ